MFEQDSALALRAFEKVEFLDREMPDFMSPCCLVLTPVSYTHLTLPTNREV